MTPPQLDARTRTALGQQVRTFAEPERMGWILLFSGLGFSGFVLIMALDGTIDPKHLWIFFLGVPALLAFMACVGWLVQFRKPYLAVGTKGVAFPLACKQVIPWSHIESIRVYSEWTHHGHHREQHVAVAVELRQGSLNDYQPTWRSLIPVFGYRSYFLHSIILISTIYCGQSPDEIREILATSWPAAPVGPWGKYPSEPA